LKRPVVAFYDIEAEIYAKARRRINDHMPGDSSEEDDNDDDDDDDDRSPTRKDREFELDGDIDLTSPLLRDILSDERPALGSEGAAPPTVAIHGETRNREATEEEWENM